MIFDFAQRSHSRIFVCPAIDTTKNSSLSPLQKAAVAALDPKLRGDLPDELEIVIGMPCMITSNISPPLGLANGARGTVVGICPHPADFDLLLSNSVSYISYFY